MITDALLSFIPIGSPLTITSAALASPNIIDLSGAGLGVTPPNIWGAPTATGQTPTVFGSPDAMGVGGARPELNVTTGTVFASGTNLNVALQGAIDNGSNQPSTWNTFVETGTILTANLTANTVIARFPWLPPFPASLRPRFLRLLFTPSGTFTTGTIASALVVFVRDDQFNKYAAKSFQVA
jgi:hypothetical protein